MTINNRQHQIGIVVASWSFFDNYNQHQPQSHWDWKAQKELLGVV